VTAVSSGLLNIEHYIEEQRVEAYLKNNEELFEPNRFHRDGRVNRQYGCIWSSENALQPERQFNYCMSHFLVV
jgi:hypothetical protein